MYYVNSYSQQPMYSAVHKFVLIPFREFEGSIQRYQWFFSGLPEMLCDSEMEVEQHTCWSGQDVVERSVCYMHLQTNFS